LLINSITSNLKFYFFNLNRKNKNANSDKLETNDQILAINDIYLNNIANFQQAYHSIVHSSLNNSENQSKSSSQTSENSNNSLNNFNDSLKPIELLVARNIDRDILRKHFKSSRFCEKYQEKVLEKEKRRQQRILERGELVKKGLAKEDDEEDCSNLSSETISSFSSSSSLLSLSSIQSTLNTNQINTSNNNNKNNNHQKTYKHNQLFLYDNLDNESCLCSTFNIDTNQFINEKSRMVLNTEWTQLELIQLQNETVPANNTAATNVVPNSNAKISSNPIAASSTSSSGSGGGFGFGITGNKSTGVVVKALTPGGSAQKVNF
jgi:hypothetical protein